MNNSYKAADQQSSEPMLLKKRLQKILTTECLDVERRLVKSIAAELDADVFECAAALLHLMQNFNKPVSTVVSAGASTGAQPGIKMVRYRLDVGSKHHISLEELKKVLVEESGVDKNCINNVNIQGLYTLIELPDAMPPDIFQHLKLVEINQRKLDIRRVKTRNNKKRGNIHNRRERQRNPKSTNVASNQSTGDSI
ncbi:MAG: DbpA RNA binding domain-containing protein [Methylovulum sp.]